MIDLRLGDCLEVLRSMEDNSVDSIVTDPPYGISMMGKQWDYDVPSVDIWTECLRVLKPGGHLLAFAGTRTQHRMAVNIEDAGFNIRDMIAWLYGSGFPKSHNIGKKLEGWNGWGTALKPALEPITVARKPFKGNVANNVLEHGTGAINIDECRVHGPDALAGRKRHGGGIAANHSSYVLPDSDHESPAGRWPANLMHDGSDEVTELFGDAARFFYCAKANKKDREDGNSHPTVKPTDLMAYLCRLVTPPEGIVLDPFMGSGSTGKAAVREGFSFIGIEREDEYHAIALDRIMKEGMSNEQLSLIA
jgi:site-specific DNA-methyltransferase (adenine-specific)